VIRLIVLCYSREWYSQVYSKSLMWTEKLSVVCYSA